MNGRSSKSRAPHRARRSENERVVWIDGRFVAGSDARISPADRGFLLGDGLFETMRLYEGEPFLLSWHLERLQRSAGFLEIPFPRRPLSYWRRVIRRLSTVNGLPDAALRLTVSRGVGHGLAPPPASKPTLLLQVRPLEPDLARMRASGVKACIAPFERGVGPFVQHKTLGYLPAVVARTRARRRNAYEALYTTPRGHVTEATTANLFVVHGRRIRTPGDEVLPGTSRRLVIMLCRRLGYAVSERPVTRSHLARASEVFLTSSVVEVLPVVRIEGRVVGNGRPGPVTRALQRAYADRVAKEGRRAAKRSTRRTGKTG